VARPPQKPLSALFRTARGEESLPLGYWAAVLFLLAIVTLVVLGPSADNGFVLDDAVVVVENPMIRPPVSLKAIFTTDYTSPVMGRGGSYRPLATLSFAANYRFSELNPRGYHLTNIALHWLNSFLVFALAWLLTRRLGISLAVALLFALHPVHAGAINPAEGRTELLAFLGVNLTLLAYLRSLSGKAWLWLPIASLCFFLALISKEHALTLVGLVVCYDFVMRRGRWEAGRTLASRAAHYLFLLPPLILFFMLRYLALGQFLPDTKILPFDNPLVQLALLPRLISSAWIALRYLGLLVFPYPLRQDYSSVGIFSETTPAGLGLLALFLGLVAGAVWISRKHPAILFGWLFYLATYLFVSNLPFVLGTIMAERLLYLPSEGFLLFAVPLASQACERLSAGKRAWLLQVVLTLLAAFGAGALFLNRNRDFKDELTLFTREVKTSPESARAWFYYGGALEHRSRYEEAERAMLKALELRPEYSEPYLTLGTIAVRRGDYARGEDCLKKAISFGPLNAKAYTNLGTLYAMTRNYEEALKQFKTALGIRPQLVDVQLNLAQCYLDLGRPQDAEGIVLQVLKRHPELARAQSLYARLQQLKKAGPSRP